MSDPVLYFEGLGLCFYRTDGIRRPRAGEYYLSGAIVEAHKAYTTLPSHYLVVIPTNLALPHKSYIRGATIVNGKVQHPCA